MVQHELLILIRCLDVKTMIDEDDLWLRIVLTLFLLNQQIEPKEGILCLEDKLTLVSMSEN